MKNELRTHFRKQRKLLSIERRQEASLRLVETLMPALERFTCVLSFSNLPEEINLQALNAALAAQHKLALPKVVEEELKFYHVSDLKHLVKGPMGILEPDPQFCPPLSIDPIDCVLVPGLAFDITNMRLGYGRGHYDRLLNRYRFLPAWGIAFKEQFSSEPLPTESHDMRVTKVHTF